MHLLVDAVFQEAPDLKEAKVLALVLAHPLAAHFLADPQDDDPPP